MIMRLRTVQKARKKLNPSFSNHWMDVVPSLCFLLDKKGIIVASNRLARKETGYREADLRGHAVWDYLNKDSRDLFKKFFRRA